MELTEQEKSVLKFVEMLIRRGDSEEEAASAARVMLGDDAVLVDKVLVFRHAIADERRVIATGRALFDPEEEAAPWYTGPSDYDIFWPALRTRLESEADWRQAVPSLDGASTDIVGLLADPHSASIRTRGLVLGFVQSGKTANFTATIAKAADAGYRVFIVLSGVHNSLRRQTQLRIDEHLVNMQPTKWVSLTDEHRDFGRPVKALPLLHSPDLRLIAVVKKNVTRMNRLNDWLAQAHAHGGLDSAPILIIDDEADQASPNAARNPDLDRTKINERLRKLLSLPRVAYIGYTATPFANVLVNPSDVEDIYPRTFIYSLPKPDGYFGSRELFGKSVSEEEALEADAPHDLIRIVPDEEAELHSLNHLQDEGPAVTPSLAEAISWFVLATSARRARDGVARHSSMLVHTTMRVDPQLEYLAPIQAYGRRIAQRVVAGEVDALRILWESEISREPASRHGLQHISFDQLLPNLSGTIAELKVLADNGRSTERLIYSDEPATVIAVGGNTLSRGLTLEGLVSSFFLRSSGTYDTLLQMGRWFGYRPGYADLPRIWTTWQLADDFEYLSDVEDSLRSEISRYRTMDGANPLKLPVRIRLHPRMQVTSKLKMYYAIRGDASFSAQRPQTTYFAHKDAETIESNRRAAEGVLRAARGLGAEVENQGNRVVIRGVPAETVQRFLGEYQFHPDSQIESSLMSKYIAGQRQHGALDLWNIVVIGVNDPKDSVSLGLDVPSPLITRSKLERTSNTDRAVIGTLMSKPDRVADLVPASQVKRDTTDDALQAMRDQDGSGLLVLYPIDKDSSPKPGARGRIALDAADHLVGAAFCFPTAAVGSEAVDTIQVDLSGVSDELDAVYEDDEDSQDEVSFGDA